MIRHVLPAWPNDTRGRVVDIQAQHGVVNIYLSAENAEIFSTSKRGEIGYLRKYKLHSVKNEVCRGQSVVCFKINVQVL